MHSDGAAHSGGHEIKQAMLMINEGVVHDYENPHVDNSIKVNSDCLSWQLW